MTLHLEKVVGYELNVDDKDRDEFLMKAASFFVKKLLDRVSHIEWEPDHFEWDFEALPREDNTTDMIVMITFRDDIAAVQFKTAVALPDGWEWVR